VNERSQGIESQKEFAQTIVPLTKFAGVLFTLRKTFGVNIPNVEIEKLWRNSAELITKVLFK